MSFKYYCSIFVLKLRSKRHKRLTAYQLSKDEVVYIDRTVKGDTSQHDPYPHLKCPYKDKDCSSNCALFNTSWETGSIIYCGQTSIGVLA